MLQMKLLEMIVIDRLMILQRKRKKTEHIFDNSIFHFNLLIMRQHFLIE